MFSSLHNVHAWVVPIFPSYKNHLSLLSVEEIQRFQNFRFEIHSQLFACSHIAMRLVLSKYTGLLPEEIEFSHEEKGKPLINDSSIKFNLSHSHDLALLAVCQEDEIGCDIEFALKNAEFDQLAQRFFSANEASKLLRLPKEQKREAFYTCWTRKEAFIKAIGEGLSYPLSEFEVSFLPTEQPRLLRIGSTEQTANQWSLLNLQLPENYKGALVVKKKHPILSNWVFGINEFL